MDGRWRSSPHRSRRAALTRRPADRHGWMLVYADRVRMSAAVPWPSPRPTRRVSCAHVVRGPPDAPVFADAPAAADRPVRSVWVDAREQLTLPDDHALPNELGFATERSYTARSLACCPTAVADGRLRRAPARYWGRGPTSRAILATKVRCCSSTWQVTNRSASRIDRLRVPRRWRAEFARFSKRARHRRPVSDRGRAGLP